MNTNYYNGSMLATSGELSVSLGTSDPSAWKQLGGWLPIKKVNIDPNLSDFYNYQYIQVGELSYIQIPVLNDRILDRLNEFITFTDLTIYNDSNFLNDLENTVNLKGIQSRGLQNFLSLVEYKRSSLEINSNNELVIDGSIVPAGTTVDVKRGDTYVYTHSNTLAVDFVSVSRASSMAAEEVMNLPETTSYTFRQDDNIVQLIVDDVARLEFQRQDFTAAETT